MAKSVGESLSPIFLLTRKARLPVLPVVGSNVNHVPWSAP